LAIFLELKKRENQYETIRWKNVLERLINVTIYLAKNNMAFIGTSDKPFTPNNGKFLSFVELLSKVDTVVLDHVKLAIEGDIRQHYCGKHIQNELIALIGNSTRDRILELVMNSTYYSIIAD